jgi:hypothetical protein
VESVIAQIIGLDDDGVGQALLDSQSADRTSRQGPAHFGKPTDLTSCNDNGVANAENVLDAANPQAQHALSDFNTSKKLTIDGIYEVPSAFKQGLGNKILGGWNWRGFRFSRAAFVSVSTPQWRIPREITMRMV